MADWLWRLAGELPVWLQDPWVGEGVFAALIVIPTWIICRRAGAPRPLALLVFIPILGFTLVLAILAFRAWPGLPGRKN